MKLFPFQQRTFEFLSQGRSVILQAPTGAGKTRAALHPFFFHLKHSQPVDFPRQCIYSVPMRALANQFEAEYQKEQECRVTLQTGDQPNDPTVAEGDLVFTTIDQTLSNALGVPYALSKSRANLNAGAVFSSYLVFDEFHLFPSDGAFKTTLQVLRALKGIIPFVLMTATFSTKLLHELTRLLDAEVVTVSVKELPAIPSQCNKVRQFHTVPDLLNAEAIMQTHKHRSIAICNTVDRAQQLYIDLCKRVGPERLILLHSRFTRQDRHIKEESVRREFGKKKKTYSETDLILIATQVIEVGLDITCQSLHTEVASASSVLQRAGRCTRFPNERGEVYVYDVPLDKKGERNYSPYERTLCQRTWEVFLQRDGEVLDFSREQNLIDQVHTDADQQLLQKIAQEEGQIWNQMTRAIAMSDTSVRRDLIRQIDNCAILVHDEPANLRNPFACEGFSLWHGTVRGKFAELETWRQEKELDWALKYPVEEEEESEVRRPPRYRWDTVRNTKDLENAFVFAVNPSLATYDEQLGFRFVKHDGGYITQQPQLLEKQRENYTYHLESYADHIRTMMCVYQRDFAERLAYTAQRLEEKANFPMDGIDRALRLAIALHDLGKLEKRWQAWVRAYQAEIDEPLADPTFMAVHTHTETPEHEAAARRVKLQRPPHAGEGAIAGVKIAHQILDGNEGLRRAVITAVARHHSAQTKSFEEYQLHDAAYVALQDALNAVSLDSNAAEHWFPYSPKTNLDKQILKSPPDSSYFDWIAYFLIVRLLRLVDGKSQEE